MKKIITVFLIFTMILSMSLAVAADPGAFLNSPSKNPAPVLVDYDNASEDCLAQVIVTAYANRHLLPDDVRAELEAAYKLIVESRVTGALDPVLKDFADALGVNISDLAVSDLFDVRAVGCDAHENHGHFDITLKADTLKDFVCLLHFYNGEIRVVKDAKVTQNGEHLEFTEDEFSPFAIVVNTAPQEPSTPPTNDNFVFFVTVAVISGLILLVLVINQKKNKA